MKGKESILSEIHKDDFDGNLVCGGKSFHERTNRVATIEAVTNQEWGKKFFAERNGITGPKDTYFESLVKCPCCDRSNFEIKIKKGGLSVTQCFHCGFGFQNPRIKREYVAELYKKTYVMDAAYSSPIARRLDYIKYQYGIQISRNFIGGIESVLDVGCGSGLSLDAYEKMGIANVFGIDPAVYTNATTNDQRISRSHIDEIPETFSNLSLITLWDTLEHIHDFKRLIHSIYRALRSDGLVLIMVPNFLSLATRLIRERSPVFQIDHLSYFTESSLIRVLEAAGFNVQLKETVISEIDNCRNYLEFQEPYFSTPSNESAFDWLTPDYIHSNMLGSRLLVVAKK